MAEIDKPAPCPKCKKAGTRLVTAFSYMVGLHLKTPAKAIFRKPVTKKNALSPNKAKTKKSSKKKSRSR
jgi:hypothetical protein